MNPNKKAHGPRQHKTIDGVLYLKCSQCKQFFQASADNFLPLPYLKYGYASNCNQCKHKKSTKPTVTKKRKTHAEREYLIEQRDKANAGLINFMSLIDLITRTNLN